MMSTEFWINILLPLCAVILPVFATIYTVNMRMKNQNRENHQPYLVLRKIEDLENLDFYKYYLTIIGRNYSNSLLSVDELQKIKHDNDISISIILQNIGYGVATNIVFYNLLDAEQIHGTQESNKDKNQKLFTTFDIAMNTEKSVQARIISCIANGDEHFDDSNRLLCVYKDLNNNIYDFIFTINIKSNNTYDFFAYQQSSRSYKRLRNKYNREYKKIIKNYRER